MDRDKAIEESGGTDLKLFYNKIQELHQSLSESFKNSFNRSLPFPDELLDRWKRAQNNGFGKGASIYDSSYIFGDVKVGENTWIGPFTILDGSGGLEIGSFCSISAGVQIYTHDTVKWALSSGKYQPKKDSVKIGDSCYIGPNVLIGKGVEIGSYSVIGTQSFVNKNIPPNSIAFGVPAKIVGEVVFEKGDILLKYFSKP
ncbi:MAG TPA: acyltransferase [Cytophagales bacterium]|nr:acyltransferase [Cytophagales bacterium]